jgi:predicted nucleotidyltransferase
METIPEENPIEIKPTGSFFETDEQGFLINPTSREKIQEEWKPLIEDIIEIYKKIFGEKLVNVYLRGSVAKGEAVSGISDIDTWAYVELPENEIKNDWTKSYEEELTQKYPFVRGIELGGEPVTNHTDKGDIIFLNQSLCIFGEPFKVPKVKPGKEMIVHAFTIEKKNEMAYFVF